MTPLHVFLLLISTAFGAWWMYMTLAPTSYANMTLRDVPWLILMFAVVGSVIWPLIFFLQLSLGYDWKQFGKRGVA